jgi:hypothetical protein
MEERHFVHTFADRYKNDYKAWQRENLYRNDSELLASL